MNASLQTLTVTNDIAEIACVTEFIEGYCAAQGAAPDVVFKFNLAVEEALVNTITYGYNDDACHVIELEIAVQDGALVLSISDDAVAFNPLEAPLPNVDAPLEDRNVGGLGVYLIRTTMDDVQYARKDNKNKLTLTKRF
ncbi:MAG: ATP-binding protein [Pseudomonadota bacterium]